MEASVQINVPATLVLGKAPEGRLDGRYSRSRLLGEKVILLLLLGIEICLDWVKCNVIILKACGLQLQRIFTLIKYHPFQHSDS
jgi:hypothetical protein